MPPYTGYASIWINGDIMRCRIQALNRLLPVEPFPLLWRGLMGLSLPQQTFIEFNAQSVQIMLHPGMRMNIIFDTQDDKTEYITKLGNLNVEPSSNSNAK